MKEDKPSFTAVFVALTVIMLGQIAFPLVPPGSVPLQMALLEAVGLPWDEYLFLLLLRSPLGPLVSRLVIGLADMVCPKSLKLVGFRKCFIQQQVQQFLQEHATQNPQVLILAAGYDTLSLRLAKQYPQVPFWEIDHPATGNFKNKIWTNQDSNNTDTKGPLRILGTKPDNLHHATVDLTIHKSLAATLGDNNKKPNYNIASPTVVIVEGLSMYLTKEQIQNLLEDISHAVGPQSIVTFDMLATKYDDKDNQPYPDCGFFLSPLILLYLKLKSEPWLLGLDAKILKEDILGGNNSKWTLHAGVESYGPANLAAIRLRDS
ncbi:Leucine carboxyl methyltransferase [Seminavis robusta]|uniref:Leucine carboxyl methyltransferase n=1 Tax=Seminavis robusta TaxID=568900 RepID=A0A9N8E7C7_9STRA|nr:Leucine carboxyl methyltransferase [Seminavis robusta]|eukprot:Sro574_g169100.1 Leucine carboxyl methyltransferase (319) ;mRNA; f:7932-8888